MRADTNILAAREEDEMPGDRLESLAQPGASVSQIRLSRAGSVDKTRSTAPESPTSGVTTALPRKACPGDFELLKVIGMGAFGKVIQASGERS